MIGPSTHVQQNDVKHYHHAHWTTCTVVFCPKMIFPGVSIVTSVWSRRLFISDRSRLWPRTSQQSPSDRAHRPSAPGPVTLQQSGLYLCRSVSVCPSVHRYLCSKSMLRSACHPDWSRTFASSSPPASKIWGRYCFHRSVFVNRGGVPLLTFPWSQVLSWGGGGTPLSLVQILSAGEGRGGTPMLGPDWGTYPHPPAQG